LTGSAQAVRTFKRFPRRSAARSVSFLYEAQQGRTHSSVKPLHGFGGAGVLEAVINDDGNTFRAVYTVRFADAIYVLHVFEKKSTRGSATPRRHLELIRLRLRAAEVDHQQRSKP
jgi:phage-related protein